MFYWDPGGSCKFYEVKYSPSATGPSQYIHQHTNALSNSMEHRTSLHMEIHTNPILSTYCTTVLHPSMTALFC